MLSNESLSSSLPIKILKCIYIAWNGLLNLQLLCAHRTHLNSSCCYRGNFYPFFWENGRITSMSILKNLWNQVVITGFIIFSMWNKELIEKFIESLSALTQCNRSCLLRQMKNKGVEMKLLNAPHFSLLCLRNMSQSRWKNFKNKCV